MNLFRPLLLAVTALALAHTAPALADKGGKGRGNDQGWGSEHSKRDNDTALIKIEIGDRNILRDYLSSDYRAHCPPGLAKKRPACVPPGQAKKWAVGYPLPAGINFYPLPDSLLGRLGAVPRGYEYVRVDKDILLVSEASKKVIDAVTLLSAVGN
ncbi:MAG: hypothetical protein GC136_01745 [Alphaproteobacteria bacterium]|nr:hypothetical protein [Alphaproteobacteria bacterium]